MPPPGPRTPTTLDGSDAAFVARLKANEGGAYEELVRLHGGRMLTVARRILRDEGDAQDAVQDAFVNAFRAIGKFSGDALLATWLHRIVVNAALMRLRTRKRRREESIDALLPAFQDDGHFAEPAVSWGEAAGDRLESEETLKVVRALVDKIPETFRTVLILRDIEGLDTSETARLLATNPNTVKIRLHRARLALRTMLDAHLRGGRP